MANYTEVLLPAIAYKKQDSSSLINVSHLDIDAMGKFDKGNSRNDDQNEKSDSDVSFFNMPDFDFADMMQSSFPKDFNGSYNQTSLSSFKNLLSYLLYLIITIISLVIIKCYKRIS